MVFKPATFATRVTHQFSLVWVKPASVLNALVLRLVMKSYIETLANLRASTAS